MEDDFKAPGLRERVRWANVAKAAAAVVLVALVVAWPRLSSDAPALPDAPVVDTAGGGPAPAVGAAAEREGSRPAVTPPRESAPDTGTPRGDGGERRGAGGKGGDGEAGAGGTERGGRKKRGTRKKRSGRKKRGRKERGGGQAGGESAPPPTPSPLPPQSAPAPAPAYSPPPPRARPHPNGGEFVPG